MTIKDLLKGEQVNVLQLNILKAIDQKTFVVGDATGLAVMHFDEKPTMGCVEEGKGIKLLKPKKIDEETIACHPKFEPMKTKALAMKVNQKKVDEMATKAMQATPVDRGIAIQDIIDSFAEHSIIQNILAIVTSVSREIEGKYGSYQICNLRDCNGTASSINLYKTNIGKLETHKIFRITKIKKTAINTQSGIRLACTNYTTIVEATSSEAELFKDTKLADKKFEGTCLMFNNFSYYKSCSKHLTKIDNNQCKHCGELQTDDGKLDFRCVLLLENKENEIIAINIFKRHLNIEIPEETSEDEVQQLVEDYIVSKRVKIDYNALSEDNKVAVKVSIM